MPQPALYDELTLQGASAADLAWFEAIGWDDARVPPADDGDAADYARREALLQATMRAQTFAARGESLAGRLAAAIGARLADLRESGDADEDEVN